MGGPDARAAAGRSSKRTWAMSFLSKHIDGLLLMDWQSVALLGLICAVAAFFIKDYLSNPLMVVFIYPVLLIFSILTQYILTQTDLYSPKKLDQWLMWTIVASIAGTIIGMGLIACIISARDRSSRA
jgi:hypothetical protein